MVSPKPPNIEQSRAGEPDPPNNRAEMAGRVLSERYRLEELLASGGFGAVYRGLHLHMRKQVAIKILHPEIENFPELVERFEREAIAGAHISHVNVAVATDIGKFDGDSYFLVQEYVRGETLRDLMDRGPLPPGRAGRVARQIAEALGAAHRHGIVHRDLKPTNVMLVQDTQDFVKLIDFGFARVPAGSLPQAPDDVSAPDWETSQPGVVFGTVSYLAPEAALGMSNVTELSDLYALGVLLYEMLAGRHPFDVSLPSNELFAQHRHASVPPISERSPDVQVPEKLEAVVRRLLEKDPENRFLDAPATIGALDDALGDDAAYVARANPDSVRPSRFEETEPRSDPGGRAESQLGRAWNALMARPRAFGLSLMVLALLALVLVRVRAASQPAPASEEPIAPVATAPPAPPPEPPKETFERRYRRETIQELQSLAPEGDLLLAAGALLALVDVDAESLSQEPAQSAAVTVVTRLPQDHEQANPVFYALAHKSGSHGLDVLYRVIEHDPAASSARRAESILARAGVKTRASPALRVTWALHRAACRNKPALFERAGTDGDERTLRLLVPLQSRRCNRSQGQCCFGRNLALDRAVELLEQRTRE
jgi:eukaryotic-like serine/threonine-protein kinase